MSVVHYDSLKDFFDACPTPGKHVSGIDGKGPWAGNQDYKDAYINLWQGDADAVKRSDDLLEKLESDGLELAQTTWKTGLVGYVPCVPAFLAGDPESMFAPENVQSNTAPIRVFASVCLSAGFSGKDLEKRGIMILALVRKLAMIRPVELYVYSEQEGQQPCVKIETTPLDLTSVSYVLGNPGFLRLLCFAWGYDQRGFHGGWADWHYGGARSAGEALGARPEDLIITGSHISHTQLDNPLEWIEGELKKYTTLLEDAG